MEVVLTRLRDFSCKEATFDERDQPAAEETCQSAGRRLDIERALAWLRRELMEMRSQDQALIRQLMDLHAGIQELKQECCLDNGEEEEEEAPAEEEEERCWDSGSEVGGSSTSSYSGEGSVYPSLYPLLPPLYPLLPPLYPLLPPLYPLFHINALHLGLQPQRGSNRRSSVP